MPSHFCTRLALTILLSFSLLSSSLTATPAHAEIKKIGLRFTAASFFFQQDFQPNRPLDILVSHAGFDAVFRGSFYNDSTWYLVPGFSTEVLFGGGSTALRESDSDGNSGATCDGTLHYDPNHPPGIRGQDVSQTPNSPIKVIRIMIPGINNNTDAAVGMLADYSQVYYACMTPKIGTFVSGSGVQQTFDWYPKGAIIPEDSNPDSAGLVRGTNAVFQFDISKLPITVPLAFKRESKIFVGADLIDYQKHIWFGQVFIYEDKGEKFGPIDPFTYGGYVPPSIITESPDDPPPPPAAPPPPVVWTGYLDDLVDTITNHLRKIGKRWQQILTGQSTRLSPRIVAGSVDQYSTATSSAFIFGLPAAPGDGKIEVHLVFRAPDKVRGYKAKLSASAIDNPIFQDHPVNIAVHFDAKAKKALKSADGFTGFVVVRITAADGKVYEKIGKFKKAKRKNVKKGKKPKKGKGRS